MKKVDQWIKSCIKKKSFKDQSTAELQMKKSEKKFKIEMRVYYCPHCTNFHLTSKKP